MKKLTPSLSLQQRQQVAVVLLLLLAAASWRQDCDAASGFCASKCAVRCGRARAKGRGTSGGGGGGGGGCLRSCGLCCEECNCVPTAARDECPCYRDMLTAGPRKTPKCP